MKSGKFWLAVLAAGVVMNVLDYLVYSMWLGPTYIMSNTDLFRQDTNPMWWVVGDFVAVFVFAWIYDKVSPVFGATAMDGAKAGAYLGIFASFPMAIFFHLMFNGYPYSLSWINVVYSVIWYVIAGYVLAMIMKKEVAAKA